jgi:hypothetical protein
LGNRAPSLETAPQPKQVVIAGDGVRLRGNQSETSDVKKIYNTGERAAVISENNDWIFLKILSDGQIGYVKSSFVKAAPARDERAVLTYSDGTDDPPADLENLLNRLVMSDIAHVRIVAHSDLASRGLALARVTKAQALLEKKGVSLTIIDIEPVSLPNNPAQSSQVEVTLSVIGRSQPLTQ